MCIWLLKKHLLVLLCELLIRPMLLLKQCVPVFLFSLCISHLNVILKQPPYMYKNDRASHLCLLWQTLIAAWLGCANIRLFDVWELIRYKFHTFWQTLRVSLSLASVLIQASDSWQSRGRGLVKDLGPSKKRSTSATRIFAHFNYATFARTFEVIKEY